MPKLNNKMNLDNIISSVKEIAISTGNFINNERDVFNISDKEKKGKHNFVTYVDKESEIRIINYLHKLLPEAGFIAEEGTSKKTNENLNWVIDPLDGTTNFIHGMPPFAISIALLYKEKPILGVIYEIGLNECFSAHIESKSFLNNKEIKVSEIHSVNESLIATGFPYTNFSRLKEYFDTMNYFMRNSHGLRRLGSAATDLAYVACGRCDAFYEYGLNAWDVAAGCIIIEQAGGKIADFNGKNNYIFGNDIVATNNNIHNEFVKIINNLMN